MLRIVENLESAGLLEREPHRTHRRVLNVSLTLRGMRLLDRAHQAVAAVDRRMLRALTPGEAITVDDLLRCCIQALQ